MRRQRRVAIVRISALLLLGAAVVAGVVGLYRSSAFTVTRVEVTGITYLTEERVRERAALPPDATLLRLPVEEVVERLEADPWIAAVALERDFPDGVRLVVTERVPVALVDVGEASFWLVDRAGTVLEQRTPEPTDTVVVVRDLTDFEPVPGEEAGSDALINAIEVVEGISDELRARVRAVSAPSVDLTTLMTTDDIEILVGSAEDIARKDTVARGILTEQQGRVVYINVRTADRPTWRGLDLP